MNYTKILFLSVTLLAWACNQTSENGDSTADNESTWWINSYKVECTGVGKQMCLQIQKGEEVKPGAWENFYNEIRGFDWQPGFVYKLKVRENEIPANQVPADASSMRYTLVEVIQKESDPVMRLHDIWALETLNGKEWKSSTLERPTIEIVLTTGKVMGTDGCNRYHGDIQKVTSEEFVIGPLASTKKACPGLDLSDEFHKAMSKVKAYTLDQLTLTLTDKDGNNLLRFRKVD